MKLRSKVVEIEAILWNGENAQEIKEFVGYKDNGEEAFLLPSEITGVWHHPCVWNKLEKQWIHVPLGHYVLRGLKGEFYPCEPEALWMKYEIIDG